MKSSTVFALAALVAVLMGGPSSVEANHSPSEEAFESHTSSASAETEAHDDAEAEDHHEESGEDTALIGMSGDAVKKLQTLLIEKGYLTTIDAPTGYYGSLTAAAVAAFMSATPAAHAHEAIDVSEWNGTPSVSIALEKDAMAGWNLQVEVSRFKFAPEHVNDAVRKNEGHAHVYINGKKYARLYGEWMHLPAELFIAGHNEVRVTLNANNHSELEHDGEIIEASTEVHN